MATVLNRPPVWVEFFIAHSSQPFNRLRGACQVNKTGKKDENHREARKITTESTENVERALASMEKQAQP